MNLKKALLGSLAAASVAALSCTPATAAAPSTARPAAAPAAVTTGPVTVTSQAYDFTQNTCTHDYGDGLDICTGTDSGKYVTYTTHYNATGSSFYGGRIPVYAGEGVQGFLIQDIVDHDNHADQGPSGTTGAQTIAVICWGQLNSSSQIYEKVVWSGIRFISTVSYRYIGYLDDIDINLTHAQRVTYVPHC